MSAPAAPLGAEIEKPAAWRNWIGLDVAIQRMRHIARLSKAFAGLRRKSSRAISLRSGIAKAVVIAIPNSPTHITRRCARFGHPSGPRPTVGRRSRHTCAGDHPPGNRAAPNPELLADGYC